MLCAGPHLRSLAALCPVLPLAALLLGSAAEAQVRKAAPAGSRLLSVRGEVRIKRYRADSYEPASAPAALSRRDEIETRVGGAEIEVDNGMVVELQEGTHVAIIGRDSGVDLYFAKGALRARPGQNGEVHSVQVVCGAGRLTLRGRDVRLRGDATTATIQVLDGMASVWGKGGVVARTGQMVQIEKGAPPAAPRPLPALAAPTWSSADGLYLGGDLPPVVALRWQPQPGAARYRLELLRTDEPGHAPLVLETEASRAELRELRVGAYLARLFSLDDKGARSEPSEPRRVLVAGLLGLSSGAASIAAGTWPRVLTPSGMTATVQVDGVPLGPRGLPAGEHHLVVTLGGLTAEVTARAAPAPRDPRAPEDLKTAAREAPAPRRDDERAAATLPPAKLGLARATRPRPFTAAPAPDSPPGDLPPPEDALLLGPSEIPGGGVRSPWAGRLLQLRFESTGSGAARLLLHGRFTARNGFGGEVSLAFLRAQLGAPPPPEAGAPPSFGNLSGALRSPRFQRGPFALQGVLGATFPISGSALDEALYEVPAGAAPVVLPSGGGWRVEAALLLGLRVGRFSLVTQQGTSLRLSGGILSGYEGGAMVQADAIRQLRLIALCQWSVNALGVPIEAGDAAVDAGAAVGGGLELHLPGPLGGVRLSALGRAGVGSAGAALYGRGSIGLQAGYRFH